MNSLFEEIWIALHGVWLRRWLALAVAWGGCLAGWLAISTIPNKYESKASVFVHTQSLLPDKLGITPAERKNNIDGITQTLTSAENLEKVIRGTDLAQQGATPGEIANQVAGLRKNITIVAKQDNLFEISAIAGYDGLSNANNAKLARDVGVPATLVAYDGQMLKLLPGPAKLIDEVPVGRKYRDGRLIIPAGDGPVRERRRLSVAGIVIVAVAIDQHGEIAADPDVALDGVPTETIDGRSMEDLVIKAADGALDSMPPKRRKDENVVRDAVRRSVRAAVDQAWGKKPIVKVLVCLV